MISRPTIIAFCFLQILFPTLSVAGAWPQLPGKSYAAFYYYMYSVSKGTKSDGSVVPFQNNGHFLSHGVGLYYEYGVSKKWTAVAIIPYGVNWWTDDFNKSFNHGFTDLEAGARYLIAESPVAFSVQILAGFPQLYSINKDPVLGYGQQNFHLSTLVGLGYDMLGIRSWLDMEGGYKVFLGSVSNQLRYKIVNGMHLSHLWIAILQLEGTETFSEGSFRIGTNPNLFSGYDVLKGSLSAVYAFTYTTRLQVGYFKEILGKNSGYGDGIMASIWYQF